jgi:hypothetical protein
VGCGNETRLTLEVQNFSWWMKLADEEKWGKSKCVHVEGGRSSDGDEQDRLWPMRVVEEASRVSQCRQRWQ